MTSHAWTRPAAVADLPRIARLEAAAFADAWPPALLESELGQPTALVLVGGGGGGGSGGPVGGPASRDGSLPAAEIAGFACFRQLASEAELLRIAVDPAWRRRGIARALILSGIGLLRGAGVERCYLEVRPNNSGAIALYQDLGFELAGRRTAYYRDGADALVYCLDCARR
jgi:ribosomal-protein-alanine N-acetyltransferase